MIDGSGTLYRQLADGIVSLIDDGALRHQMHLPPERALAKTLSVSPSTVVAAYGELKERGQLTRRQGSGTQVVASQVPGPEHGELRNAPMFDPGTETRALLQAIPRPLIDVAAELRQLGSTDSPLGLDDVAQLRSAIERLRPSAIMVNPHHQNPTGTRMLPHRWRELANIAADYGVMVIEDPVFAVREPADRHLRSPFAANEAEWTMAIERLALAWRSFDPSRFERTRHRIAPV